MSDALGFDVLSSDLPLTAFKLVGLSDALAGFSLFMATYSCTTVLEEFAVLGLTDGDEGESVAVSCPPFEISP